MTTARLTQNRYGNWEFAVTADDGQTIVLVLTKQMVAPGHAFPVKRCRACLKVWPVHAFLKHYRPVGGHLQWEDTADCYRCVTPDPPQWRESARGHLLMRVLLRHEDGSVVTMWDRPSGRARPVNQAGVRRTGWAGGAVQRWALQPHWRRGFDATGEPYRRQSSGDSGRADGARVSREKSGRDGTGLARPAGGAQGSLLAD